MPVYDFSGGINALNSGIDSLGASLKSANQQQQSVALANALAAGDWNGAMKAAAAAGDTNTVLKLRELKQSNDQAAAFGTLADKILPTLGLSGTGAAATGTPLAAAGTGGAPADQVSRAILGQESGGNPNVQDSPDGAKGIGQIMPATFAQYAKPGEVITNPTDNYNVHQRIIQDYAQRYNNDPRRIAVAYFSGPGNVASPESPTPWISNIRDQGGKGTSTSSYVAGVLSRMGARGSPTGTPSALLGGGAGETQPVVRAADGTTYSGPNAAAAAADVPSPGAAPVSGTYPQLVANAPQPPQRPPGLGDTLAPQQPPADPALMQFLASHLGGPDVASRLLQAPPGTPTGSIVPPGLLPHDDAVKPAEQFIAEAKQALAGGMAHGTPQTLAPTLPPSLTQPPTAADIQRRQEAAAAAGSVAPAPGPGPSPYEQSPGTAADTSRGFRPFGMIQDLASGSIPSAPPMQPPPTESPPGGFRPFGMVQDLASGSIPSAPPMQPPPTVPAPAPARAPAVAPSAPADIAAIERTMPAVQQQAASVGSGQVNDAGMAAASALTSGQPPPQGLGASLQAPVMQTLSQGGPGAALTQGPPPAAAPPPVTAALPPSVAVDASGSTPPAETPGATAATPPPAAAPPPAIEVPGYEGKYTRAQSDDSEGNPSQAEWDKAAKEQGIGAAPAPPIEAKLPPTPAAIKAGDPVVTAAAPVSPSVARSLAQTRPGSDQRMMLFALLMRAAANSGPQSAGNVKFVEGLLAIEKQHQEDFGKTLRTVSDAELASLGYTKAPGSVVQADPWGNLKVTPPGAEPAGHIMSDAEVTANRLSPVTGTGRVWWQPGKPGEKPIAIDANTETSKVVPITAEQERNYHGAVGMYVGGKEDGKPFYPPGPLVRMEAQGEFEKVYEKAKGDIVAADMAAGNTANRRIQALSILKDASDAGGNDISSGPFGETALKIKQAVAELGIAIPDGMAPAEVAKKVGFDFATQMVKAISARPGQMEFVRALSNVPGIEMSRPGRDAMISILTQEAANDQKLALLAQNPENAKNWAKVKQDFYNDPANAIMSPFRKGPNGEPVPISKADVFIMAERAGMKPPPESKPIPPGFKQGKFGPTITDIGQMKGTFDRGTPVTLPDGTPGWTQ